MPDSDRYSDWIVHLREGDEDAVRRLWDRYFHRLVGLVRGKLPTHARRAFDEEDVALSAFNSFCAGVAGDRFPDLRDPDNLWAVLLVIGVRKAHTYVEHQTRQKRGGGRVQGESAIAGPTDSGPGGMDHIAADGYTPAFEAQVADECGQLLDSLKDDTLRTIAVLKMEGHTIDEIAVHVGCTKRAVQRRLDIIRQTWRDLADADGGDV